VRPYVRGFGLHGDLERRLAFILAALAIVAGIVTYAVTSSAPLHRSGVRTVLILLNVDLILLLALGLVVARRLIRLALERRQGSAGSRLHMRLAALFGLLAAMPAVVVSVFSVVFLSSGLEQWFSSRVQGALDNSLAVAEAYLAEHREVIRADALAMASDLEREGSALFENEAYLRHFIVAQAALRSLTEAILFDSSGRVLAHSGLGIALEVEQLPRAVLERAAQGEVVTMTSDAEDRIRAVLRLMGSGDLYLSVGRFVDPQVLTFMQRTQDLASDYRQLETQRSGIQVASALIFGVVALLLLLAAMWIGLNLADRLATPISRLIGAADRLRHGDLGARVPELGSEPELESLSRAFNRMAGQLESQRRELIVTNRQLDERRRFTEAVLAGVTAGVLSLDNERRVLLSNRSAREILAASFDGMVGVDEVFPEILPLFVELAQDPGAIVQKQVILRRGERERVLLVRAAAERVDHVLAGYVVTFDDVTDLVSAQRQAAWSEVARRIAHEIKNPLTPIRLAAERLGRRYASQVGEDTREGFMRSISTIVRQVDTIGRLVSEFSAFARMPSPTMRFEPLGEIVRGAVLLQQDAWPGIAFTLEAPSDDRLMVPCDAEKVSQALTNLLQNAVNALSEQTESGSRKQIVVQLRRTEGAVIVEVGDTGPGFPENDRERLFEPYYTTRTRGTGLGLAIVKKIMEEHQGKVELETRPSGGALVHLVFPVASPAADGGATDGTNPKNIAEEAVSTAR
jgi:two-component system, NtrC family, nitrogen regulation sensor histidine kinase NtrY